MQSFTGEDFVNFKGSGIWSTSAMLSQQSKREGEVTCDGASS